MKERDRCKNERGSVQTSEEGSGSKQLALKSVRRGQGENERTLARLRGLGQKGAGRTVSKGSYGGRKRALKVQRIAAESQSTSAGASAWKGGSKGEEIQPARPVGSRRKNQRGAVLSLAAQNKR